MTALPPISSRESTTVEFKREAVSAAKLAKELAAFATGNGGTLFLGIAESAIGEAEGYCGVASSDSEKIALIQRVESAASDLVQPSPKVEPLWLEADGEWVLAVKVAPGDSAVSSANGKPMVRCNTISREATAAEVRDLFTAHHERTLLARAEARLIEAGIALKNGSTAAAIIGQGELATKNFSDLIARFPQLASK